MSETGEIAAFCAARLDEYEAMAKAALADLEADTLTWAGFMQSGWKASGLAADDDLFDYLERHDPASVLRDVSVKRAVLADCVRMIGPNRERRRSGNRSPYDSPAANLAFRTLRSLASAYGTHPDYREAWKP